LEVIVSETVNVLHNVERAIQRVEAAVKEKWSTAQWIGLMLIGSLLWTVPADIWHAKWRYAAAYGIPSSQLYVQDKPHDCAFLAAPLGNKYCRYERTISTVRWAKSTEGNPIISYDDGKIWSNFDAAGESVPQYSTVKALYIGWEKKED
jgi:hypothetical protein